MKRHLIFLFALSLSFSSFSQMIRVNGYETILSPKESEKIPKELKNIQYKKYLSKDYKPAFVDDFKQKAFLRYNIFDDQMEFIKDNSVYYLKKEAERKVRFQDNTSYKIYQINNQLQYFLVHTAGKNALLAKQTVKFIEAKKANGGYGVDKPADYKRKKDELYLFLEDKGLVKVPNKKKDFYRLFGANTSKVKDYMKENKLGKKKVKDLKKVIQFVNGL